MKRINNSSVSTLPIYHPHVVEEKSQEAEATEKTPVVAIEEKTPAVAIEESVHRKNKKLKMMTIGEQKILMCKSLVAKMIGSINLKNLIKFKRVAKMMTIGMNTRM